VKSYRVRFLLEAAEELASLDKSIAERILTEVAGRELYEPNPRAFGRGLKGLFKLRVGSYRALHSFDRERKVIYIHLLYLVGHRREIYKLR